MRPDALTEFQSGQTTAKKAAAILVNKGFIIPTGRQRQNLLVAFAKKGKVVYGKAFDVVKLSAAIDLNDLAEIERHLVHITVCEIKSSRKKLRLGFGGFFFSLTGAEVLVARVLGAEFG